MAKQRIIFMGTPDFAVPSLEALAASDCYQVVMVVTQPDRPKGRGLKLVPPPVKVAAERLGIGPILQPEKLRKSEELSKILRCPAEFIVTVAYGQILPQKLLNHASVAAINVHASLLPAYRGSAPLHRVILQGETETGITTIKMSKTLDAGDMLLQEKLEIDEEETVGQLHDRLCRLGSSVLLRTLDAYAKNQIKPIEQNHQAATYAAPIVNQDQQIDWQSSAETLHNVIRGLNPWPVAYTTFQGQIWKLWQSRAISQGCASGVPGEILAVDETGIQVQCGQGVLKLIEIQPAGKKRMLVEAYLKGNRIQSGLIFK